MREGWGRDEKKKEGKEGRMNQSKLWGVVKSSEN